MIGAQLALKNLFSPQQTELEKEMYESGLCEFVVKLQEMNVTTHVDRLIARLDRFRNLQRLYLYRICIDRRMQLEKLLRKIGALEYLEEVVVNMCGKFEPAERDMQEMEKTLRGRSFSLNRVRFDTYGAYTYYLTGTNVSYF